ncbi:response regulator [Desulfosediminicola flagellatus]|uniref:response regulator n=1 Tax=Desulfosediminicola flagellatus TaxID=2569541 RepID=UPI0010AB5D1C|nr:response regulator [Desulfosediminicola flagellatus]
MLNSINSKFYAIAILLTTSLCLGYGILAYFQHKQHQNSILTQDAINLEQDISTLTELFHEARFWEKVILSGKVPEADMQFGTITQKMRSHFNLINTKYLNTRTSIQFNEIAEQISRYETQVAELIQLKTKHNLHSTMMETTFRSAVSSILTNNNPDLLKPLFNFTNFFLRYQSSKDLPQYQALKLVSTSLEKNIRSMQISDLQLGNTIKRFNTLLDENYEMELDTISIHTTIERLSVKIKNIFTHISNRSEKELYNSLIQSSNSRRELHMLFLFATLLGILILILILSIISRKIILPIRSIATVMQQIKHGDITARFQGNKESKDEIIQFGFAFNEMLETFESNNTRLLKYQNKLESKFHELSQRDLERQQLTAQLRRSEKMEAIGTVAGGIAHDLNNILSGMVSYPELLLLDLPEESPYRQAISAIEESGRNATALVQDLLTLARRSVGVTVTTDLNTLISTYLASPEHHKLLRQRPDVKIITKLQDDTGHIKGSPAHLSKAIMNLVINGVESINGVGTVTIATESRYLSDPVTGYNEVQPGEYTVLVVRDSGTAIAAPNLDRIFEPFFSRKNLGSNSSGLSLAVVWGTVRDHNGYIDVLSTPGIGTTFTVYFPVTYEKINPEKTPFPIESYMGNRERILVVDDIENQREIACNMLQRLGYTAMSISSGEEAVEFMQGNEADLLLLDMLMPPGIDGLETYKRILKTSPEMPAIIASGFSETDRVKKAKELGVASYIKKPYSLETLGTAVKAGLKQVPS